MVFTAPERNSHHIYMALIILLILSEDDIFNKTIHNIPIKKLSWYTERSLSEISLGGLLILVVIRTIQFNMTRMRVLTIYFIISILSLKSLKNL